MSHVCDMRVVQLPNHFAGLRTEVARINRILRASDKDYMGFRQLVP